MPRKVARGHAISRLLVFPDEVFKLSFFKEKNSVFYFILKSASARKYFKECNRSS